MQPIQWKTEIRNQNAALLKVYSYPLKSGFFWATEKGWTNLGKLWYPSKGPRGSCALIAIHHGQCGRVGQSKKGVFRKLPLLEMCFSSLHKNLLGNNHKVKVLKHLFPLILIQGNWVTPWHLLFLMSSSGNMSARNHVKSTALNDIDKESLSLSPFHHVI